MLLLGPSTWFQAFLICRQLGPGILLPLGKCLLAVDVRFLLAPTSYLPLADILFQSDTCSGSPFRMKWKNTSGPSLLKKSAKNGFISWQVAFPPFFYSMASGDVSLGSCSWSKGWSWIEFWHWADFQVMTMACIDHLFFFPNEWKDGDGCCWIWHHCQLNLPPTSSWWMFASDG